MRVIRVLPTSFGDETVTARTSRPDPSPCWGAPPVQTVGKEGVEVNRVRA
jgi:hypothetical protein